MFRRFYEWLYDSATYICIAFFLGFQVLHNSVPGDAQVFYKAGLDFRSGINPWLPSSDPKHFQFLYGPLNVTICAILSFLGNRGMYLAICLSDICLVPLTVLLLSRVLDRDLSRRTLFLLATYFLASFPVRANLQYGQFVVHYVFLLVFILYLSSKLNYGIFGEFISGSLLVFLMDFKPHLFLTFFLIVLLTRLKKTVVYIGLLSTVLFQGLVLKFITGSFLPKDWLSRIIERGSGRGSLDGYYNLLNFCDLAHMPRWLGLLCLTIFLTIASFYNKKRSIPSFWVLIVLYMTSLPVLHPQDFVFPFLLILIGHGKLLSPNFFSIFFGLIFVWSSSISMIVILVLILATASFQARAETKGQVSFFFVQWFLCSLPMLIPLVFGLNMDTYRILDNTLAVFFATFVLIYKSPNQLLSRAFLMS